MDFLLSMLVMLLIATVIFGIAYIQTENASAISVKYRAEALAMGMGSAINHYRAIGPENPTDELRISIKQCDVCCSWN